MASLYPHKNSYRVDVRINGTKRTITLGPVNKSTARLAERHIASLESCANFGESPTHEDRRWLSTLSPKITARLARVGLIDGPHAEHAPRTLRAFVDSLPHLLAGDVAPRTLELYTLAGHQLADVCGDIPLSRITTDHALEFDRLLHARRLAESTIRGYRRHAKTVLSRARRLGLLDANPFDGLPTASLPAPDETRHYIGHDEARRVMDHASDKIATLISLARYGAMRVPSETSLLRWGDINYEEGALIVPDKKRSRRRQVPLFAPLRARLAEINPGNLDPDRPVIRCGVNNLRRDLHQACRRAGLDPWPRPFQNLRASCETDLRRLAPAHIASAIVGHSRRVGDDHYDLGRVQWLSGLTTQADALWTHHPQKDYPHNDDDDPNPEPTRRYGTKNRSPHNGQVLGSNPSGATTGNARKPRENKGETPIGECTHEPNIPSVPSDSAGLPPTKTLPDDDADTDGRDLLACIVDAWHTLTPETRRRLARIATENTS
jgi:integrase